MGVDAGRNEGGGDPSRPRFGSVEAWQDAIRHRTPIDTGARARLDALLTRATEIVAQLDPPRYIRDTPFDLDLLSRLG